MCMFHLHINRRGVELLGRLLREGAREFGRENPRMKKLLIITAIGVLTIGAAGCRTTMCDRLFRGSAVATPAVMAPATICCPDPCADPCATSVAPCAPAGVIFGAPGPG